jgi:chemotaxis protein MotA
MLQDDAPPIEKSVMMGLCASCALVLFGAFIGGEPLRFLSPGGFLLVIGGTLASTLVQFSVRDFQSAMQAARIAVCVRADTPGDRMGYLVHLSRRVKDEGVLVLEDEAVAATDSFLRLGLELTVDGQSPDDIRRILKNEIRTSSDQAWRNVQVWETMGNFAPAMGLIGTLIGLIQMLGSLQDAATIGPSMSLALVATLYGSVSANLFFFPLAGKLRVIAQEREQTKEITVEGLLSVARAESPIMLEQRLQSFTSVAGNS